MDTIYERVSACPKTGLPAHPQPLTFRRDWASPGANAKPLSGRQTKDEFPVYAPIVERLLRCLAELDRLGESVAAAHVDAAIQALEHCDAKACDRAIQSEMDPARTE